MTTVWLSGLIVLGLLVLVGIAFCAHRMEMSKIENIRRASLHRDRYRDLNFIIDVVPSKPLEGELPGLLTRAMVVHLEKAMELDGRSKELRRLLEKARKLHASVVKGESLPNRVPGGSIGDQLKDVQRGIKLLKEFILQQHRGGFLSKPAATAHIKSLHEVNLTATVQGLVGQARHSISEGNRSLSLRYYQLAFNEIKKSKSSNKYTEQLEEIGGEIMKLKADQKAVDEATQQINQKLVESISKKKDGDSGSFDMNQIN
jgi:hypothetical protein